MPHCVLSSEAAGARQFEDVAEASRRTREAVRGFGWWELVLGGTVVTLSFVLVPPSGA